MPRKSSNANASATAVPRITLDNKAARSACIGKLSLKTTDVADVGEAISKLLEKAAEAGLEVKRVRGVISCY